MKKHICLKCEKPLASASSLWNHHHHQRCKKKNEEELIESEIDGLPEAIDQAYSKLVDSDDEKSVSGSDDTKSVGESDDEDENVKSDEEIVKSDEENDD